MGSCNSWFDQGKAGGTAAVCIARNQPGMHSASHGPREIAESLQSTANSPRSDMQQPGNLRLVNALLDQGRGFEASMLTAELNVVSCSKTRPQRGPRQAGNSVDPKGSVLNPVMSYCWSAAAAPLGRADPRHEMSPLSAIPSTPSYRGRSMNTSSNSISPRLVGAREPSLCKVTYWVGCQRSLQWNQSGLVRS